MRADLSQAFDGKHYLHPHSLHLVEHQIGDLVFAGGRYTHMRSSASGGLYPINPEVILQRKGIAFMWPESEAAWLASS